MKILHEDIFEKDQSINKINILGLEIFYPNAFSYFSNNNFIEFDIFSLKIGGNLLFPDKIFISEAYKAGYVFLIDNHINYHSFFIIKDKSKVYFLSFNAKDLNLCSKEFINFFQNYLLLK